MNEGRSRNIVLAATDAAGLFAVWAFTVWAYRAFGPGHYKFGAEFYLRLWPLIVAYLALNGLFRLYQGSFFNPAAPVSPVEELRRLVGSSVFTHLGLIAYLALAYQTTEHYSRAVIVISGCLTAALAQPFRDIARRIAFRFDCLRIPVVLSGDGETARRLEHAIASDAYLGFRVAERTGTDVGDIVATAKRSGVRTLVA